MSSPSFPTGIGTPVIRYHASPEMNDATTTKQDVSPSTGLVVLANDRFTHLYWHADVSVGTGPSARTADFTATPTSGTAPLTVQPSTGGAALVATAPRRVTRKALAGVRGVPIKVRVARAGKVRISGTVRARILGRRGRPIVVAAGSATAKRAGTVTVRLRLTAAGRKQRKRLKGARMTLRVRQGDLRATTRVTLR